MTPSATIQFHVRHQGTYQLSGSGLRLLQLAPGLEEWPDNSVLHDLAEVVFEDLDGHHVRPELLLPERMAKAMEVPEDWITVLSVELQELQELPDGVVS